MNFINLIIIIISFKKQNMKNNRIIIEDNIDDSNKISKKDFEHTIFAILIREHCDSCGFFAYYIKFLGCIVEILFKGELPIIDMQSSENLYNGFNKNFAINPWELFFNQIDGYNLSEVKKYGKNIKYYICPSHIRAPNRHFFNNTVLIQFWHNIYKNYIPIRREIEKETHKIMNNLFDRDNNILGILARGTDYTSIKPKSHPIPPKPKEIIKEVKKMERANKYSYYFISTEDEIIRKKFIKEFGNQLKYFKFKKDISYNFKEKKFLYNDEKIVGNLEFTKIYIINMINI